jgi:hypothetical protein
MPLLLSFPLSEQKQPERGQHEGVANSLSSIHADYFFDAGRDSGNRSVGGTTAELLSVPSVPCVLTIFTGNTVFSQCLSSVPSVPAFWDIAGQTPERGVLVFVLSQNLGIGMGQKGQ